MGLQVPSKLLRWIGERWIGSLVRQVADGKFGLRLRKLYWSAVGWKTQISILVLGVAFIGLGLGLDPKLAETVGWVGGLAVSAGLLDKAVRSSGRPAWLTDNGAYRLAIEYAGTLATALSAALAWTMSSACHPLTAWSWGVSCSVQTQVLLGVVLALVYLGILDGAMLTRAPIPPIAKRRIDELKPWGPGPGATVVLASLGLLLLSGCGSLAQLRLGEQRPLGPDTEVVEQLVCVGKVEEAQRYIELRGGSQADRIELVERARQSVSKRPGCACALETCSK
jgi:hypothetical protein